MKLNTKKYSLFLFIGIISLLRLSASSFQIEQDSIKKKVVFPAHSVGLTCSALANPVPAIQLNYGLGVTDRFRIKGDFGYILGDLFDGQASGFRLKPSVQYLIEKSSLASTYLAISYTYRYSESKRTEFVNFPNQSFIQENTYSRTRTLQGVELLFGGIMRLSDRFILDGGYGLGYGILNTVDIGNMEAGIDSEFSLRDFIGLGKQPIFIISIHLSINYVIAY